MNQFSDLSEEQRRMLEILMREQGANPDAILPIPKRAHHDWAPLSSAQERMWFAHQINPLDGAYNIQATFNLSGPLNRDALKDALQLLIERHETLRTSFEKRDDGMVQIIHPSGPVPLIEYPLMDRAGLASFIRDEALRPWDLGVAPSLRCALIATSPAEHVMLLGMHHILSDAWSLGILARELWSLYDQRANGLDKPLEPLGISYADYAEWERQRLKDDEAHSAFWREKLRDAPDHIEFPHDRPRTEGQPASGALHPFSLPPKTAHLIRDFARQQGVSPFAVCLSAFNLLLSGLTGARDLLVGTPVANRERAELEKITGYFANTIPLRMEWGTETSFEELVRQAGKSILEALEHQKFPFERIVEDFNPRRIPGTNPMVQIFFAFQQYALGDLHAGELVITEFDQAARTTQFDIEFHVWETPEKGFDAVFVYRTALFDEKTIAKWATCWTQILSAACADPGQSVCSFPDRFIPSRISALSTDHVELQRAELEQAVNNLPSVHQAVVLIHTPPVPAPDIPTSDLFPEKKVQHSSPAPPVPDQHTTPAYPKRPAQTYGGEFRYAPGAPRTLPEILIRAATDHPSSGCRFLPEEKFISYPDLLAEARRIQAWLVQAGIRPGKILLFQLETEADIIFCFWGAVFAGAIPCIQPAAHTLNPHMAEKLTAMWRFIGAPPVLSCRLSTPAWETVRAQTLIAEQSSWNGAAPAPCPHRATPEDIAFFSQTSGTSGRAKAVPLRHSNLVSRALSATAFTEMGPDRIPLNWQPLEHIGSISDWHIRCVAAGASPIYVRTQHILANPLAWLDLIEQFGVTDTWAPNFAYNLLVETLESPSASGRAWKLGSLKRCLSAGDSINARVIDRLEELMADSGFAQGVFQPAFGMAETASGITYHQPVPGTSVTRHALADGRRDFVDCGTPIPGVSMRIVDEAGEVRNEEEPGNIQFSGMPVFDGYYNDPEINAERFTADGWFDTGDLGFLLNGHLFITGRNKAEILVNGRNISCEDLELVVSLTPGVREGSVAVCPVQIPEQPDEQWAVFFVPRQDDTQPSIVSRIYGRLAEQFGVSPDFVIPVAPGDLPRTSVGKLQRHVLSRQLETGMFDHSMHRLNRGKDTLPDSFFQWEWNRSPLALNRSAAGIVYLIRNAGPLADMLAGKLHDAGHEPRFVDTLDNPLPDLRRLVDLTLLRQDPDSRDAERPIAVAEHIRSLLEALSNHSSGPEELIIVTDQAQATGRENSVNCDDAVLPGLLKSASQEFSSMRIRHIDLMHGDLNSQASRLTEELLYEASDPEVAYRGFRRLTPRAVRVDMRRAPFQPSPFPAPGFILISGGLGGIGKTLVQKLRTYDKDKPLLLVGRSMPDAEQRRFLAAHPPVAYAGADVADADAIRDVVERYEREWNIPLAGIIHLAGSGNWQSHIESLEAQRIIRLTPSAWHEQFNAKIQGTRALFDLVQKRPGARFVGASSVVGIFGAAGFSAYAAANSFLQTFCCARRQIDQADTACFNWGPWLDTGMSRGQDPAMAAAHGYLTLTPEQGAHAFMAALTRDRRDLIIGLDPNHPRAGCRIKTLVIFYTADDTEKAARDIAGLYSDQIPGISLKIEVRHTPSLPDDRSDLLRELAGAPDTRPSAPCGDIEKQLFKIFQKALTGKTLGPDDNFFESGAHSLLLAGLEAEIQAKVSSKVLLLDLFRFPSIRALADFIAGKETTHTPHQRTARTRPASIREKLRKARTRRRI